MFGNMGLHVIKNPTGTFSYVGSIPVALCQEVPATYLDIMGLRAHGEPGHAMTWKAPVFNSAKEAVDFAEARGFTVKRDADARGIE